MRCFKFYIKGKLTTYFKAKRINVADNLSIWISYFFVSQKKVHVKILLTPKFSISATIYEMKKSIDKNSNEFILFKNFSFLPHHFVDPRRRIWTLGQRLLGRWAGDRQQCFRIDQFFVHVSSSNPIMNMNFNIAGCQRTQKPV